jgi:hypothetical protein
MLTQRWLDLGRLEGDYDAQPEGSGRQRAEHHTEYRWIQGQ